MIDALSTRLFYTREATASLELVSMSDLKQVTVRVLTHNATGLKMAISEDLPGFVVHAHSFEEMDEKIPAALRSFVKATQGDDAPWIVSSESTPPGYQPTEYIARPKSRVAA
jgi:hypothetical protein